jgi:hypothetical protein
MPATSATEATAKTLFREPKAQNTVATAWLTVAEITGTMQTQAAEGKPAIARIPATIGVFLQDSLLDMLVHATLACTCIWCNVYNLHT